MEESKGKATFKKPFLISGLASIALGCALGFGSLAWFASLETSVRLSESSNFRGANQTRAGAFPTSSSAFAVAENAKIDSKTTDAFIPMNGLWAAPTKPGRFEIIASGTGVHTCVLIVRLIRAEKGNYAVGFENTPYEVPFNNDWSGGMVGFAIAGTNVVYYGLEITQDASMPAMNASLPTTRMSRNPFSGIRESSISISAQTQARENRRQEASSSASIHSPKTAQAL